MIGEITQIQAEGLVLRNTTTDVLFPPVFRPFTLRARYMQIEVRHPITKRAVPEYANLVYLKHLFFDGQDQIALDGTARIIVGCFDPSGLAIKLSFDGITDQTTVKATFKNVAPRDLVLKVKLMSDWPRADFKGLMSKLAGRKEKP